MGTTTGKPVLTNLVAKRIADSLDETKPAPLRQIKRMVENVGEARPFASGASLGDRTATQSRAREWEPATHRKERFLSARSGANEFSRA